MKSVPDMPDEAQLQRFVDGRLSPTEAAEIGGRIAADPELASKVDAYVAQRDLLRSQLRSAGGEDIPDRLRAATIVATERAEPPVRWGRTGAAMAASLALGIGIGAFGSGLRAPQTVAQAPERPMAAALIAHQVFAADKRHPVEVGADEQGHLVQWLSKRLGRPLAAPDLTGRGYRLMGGRLLPAATGPAAQFMYEDTTGRRLTLYVHAAGGRSGTEFQATSDGPVQAIYWYDRGWGYALAAETDRTKLLAAARDVHHQLTA